MPAGKNTSSQAEELFQLADELALTFWLPGAEAQRERLRTLAAMEWQRLKGQPRVLWLTYLLQLSVICPPLLEGPRGFEWIPHTLKWELYYRKRNRSADRDFWKAVGQVRAAVRRGRPSDKARDYLRHQEVSALMKKEGLNKTQAVNRLAGFAEGGWDTRAIWKSLARVEQELSRQGALLAPAPHQPVPPQKSTSQSPSKGQRRKK